jgi:putative transposase
LIRELRPKYPGLPLIRMCQLLDVPRSLAYRKPTERSERARFYDELKTAIADVVMMNPGYGYRRVRRELGRRNTACGYKSVTRAMREAGLQPKRRRPHPKTSDGKGRGNWPNLLKEAKIQAPGQAWVADITYIAVPNGFAYLACVLDVYLRKILGWAISKRIDAKLTLAALKQALATRTPEPGWIHHSDRGSQYLCEEYVDLVTGAGGQISCSDKACPEDNAFMESFFKTLKAEEVWLEDYESVDHADESVSRFIGYYNSERMHSSLGYISPEQFEASRKENDQS